ncbi:MAG: o-succinylbenzoate synthase [Sedimentibacter sp.]
MINESAVIESVKLYELKIPLIIPFQISGGVSYSRRSLIVVLESNGIKGYGESAPFDEPYYSSETISSVKALYLDLLFGRIKGRKIESIEDINSILNAGVRGNNFAKAGIENAYWDLICNKNNILLKDLIEYKLRNMGVRKEFLESKKYIESGVSVGIPEDNDINTLLKWVNEYMEEGYQRIKLKIRPGWDIEPVKAVRRLIGDFPLWVDANSSFDLEIHKDIFKEMDQYNCLFYEQPLHHDDILDHLQLSKYVSTPICFDESLKSSKIAAQVVKIGASKIWNIKIQRIAGLLEGLKIYKIASENGIKLWGGTMPESGIGAMPILNLACFNLFKYPADVEASKRWYGSDNDTIELEMDKQGRIFVPDIIGTEKMINKSNFQKYGKLIYEI